MALSPFPRRCTHQVFPSFCGADVRKAFLSHILKEFRSKGITPFIDNDIERSKSIGPELIEAIRGSRISIVLISKNYASSTWCLNELVEIMKCREELDQIVMAIFYEVDPSDAKKQIGEFGSIFDKTCAGKTEEDIKRWRKALAEVAQIAGYHSNNWKNEVAMIEEIAADVSNKLNNVAPSRDFDCLVGMGAHMEKMKPLLCLESDEVRMIGIWGPSGIGKTTNARFLFSKHSHSFDLSVFMDNIRAFMYARPACSDDYSLKLLLHQQLISRIFKQKDIEIPHLGVAEDRLKDKKVLVVLDDVDRSVQLEAMAKETQWFGPGSRIFITTQNRRLLKAHGIEDIYKVDFPATDEALQIFCMKAFGQNSPKDGFEKLSREVTRLAGNLPLGLRVIGSYFKGMSKEEWTNALPRLRSSLDGEIQSILMFSYNALGKEEKDLFLHIACFFNYAPIHRVQGCLTKKLWDIIHVLAEKSLISREWDRISVHSLLEQLGKEIARHEPGQESIRESGKRQFLVDAKDICEVLTDDTMGSRSVIGINLNLSEIEDQLNISERAFEGMSNLQFLKVSYYERMISEILFLPRGLSYLSSKLRVLHWDYFPMTCLPAKFNPEFLVRLEMTHSKLKKLWKGIRSLRNLKEMNLSFSKNLRKLPDLSTATSLKELILSHCWSLVELTNSIGNATNLQRLVLSNCSSLVKLPSSIGNATNLHELDLSGCSSLVRLPSSIGNLTNLHKSNLQRCSSLVKLPSIRSWHRLDKLNMSGCKSLEVFPHVPDCIIELNLSDTKIKEVPSWVQNLSQLYELVLSGCRKLISLPQLPNSLRYIYAEDCESLERLECSFDNPEIDLNFANCFKLNREARELIILTAARRYSLWLEIVECGVGQIIEVPHADEHDENVNSGDGGCGIKYDETESTDMQMEISTETEDDSVKKKKSRKPMTRSINNFFGRRR